MAVLQPPKVYMSFLHVSPFYLKMFLSLNVFSEWKNEWMDLNFFSIFKTTYFVKYTIIFREKQNDCYKHVEKILFFLRVSDFIFCH